MNNKIILLIFLSLIPTFAYPQEFPICTSNNDQLYPDVAFDGTNFWTVWADKRNGDFQIYGARITPQGTVLDDSGILLASLPDTDYTMPSIAFSDSIGCVAFLQPKPADSTNCNAKNVGMRRFQNNGNLIDSVPIFLKAIYMPSYQYVYINAPTVVFGKKHFFLFVESWIFYQIESSTCGEILVLEGNKLSGITGNGDGALTHMDPGLTGIWNGKRIFSVANSYPYSRDQKLDGVFIDDSSYQQDTLTVRDTAYCSSYPWPQSPRDRRLAFSGSKYFLISEATDIWPPKIWYDILSDSGKPINSIPHIINHGSSVDQRIPVCTYLNNKFIAVWQDVIGDSSNLYGIMTDTLGNIIDSGYINWASFKKQHPSIATDGNKTLLVWADNRNGNFDIYGRIMDSLSVEESSPNPQSLIPNPALSISPNPFTYSTIIRFSVVNSRDCSLKLFDISGREIKTLVNSSQPAGSYSIPLNAKDLSTGVYFVKFRTNNFEQTKKLILMK